MGKLIYKLSIIIFTIIILLGVLGCQKNKINNCFNCKEINWSSGQLHTSFCINSDSTQFFLNHFSEEGKVIDKSFFNKGLAITDLYYNNYKQSTFYCKIRFDASSGLPDFIRNGLVITYDSLGTINSIGNYQNGKLEGVAIDLFKNGEIKSIGKFSNNEKVGKWNELDYQGNIVHTSNY